MAKEQDNSIELKSGRWKAKIPLGLVITAVLAICGAGGLTVRNGLLSNPTEAATPPREFMELCGDFKAHDLQDAKDLDLQRRKDEVQDNRIEQIISQYDMMNHCVTKIQTTQEVMLEDLREIKRLLMSRPSGRNAP